MQAIELQAEIDEKHQIHLQLPENIHAQSAKIIVMFEEPKESLKPLQFGLFRGKIHMSDDFNEPLPDSFWLDGTL
jgi:hypothetical protein